MNKPSERPRVLWVDHVSRILGGAEVNLLELLAEPGARSGWDGVVACHPLGHLCRALRDMGIPLEPYTIDPGLGSLRIVGTRLPLTGGLRSLRALRAARNELAQLIERVRPTVVVSCTNKDHLASWPGCRRAGIPSIWWVNDILSSDFFPWIVRRTFFRQARRGATRLVAVSEFVRNVLLQHALFPGRVVTIRNGIPLDRYQRRPRGFLRSMLNLRTDDFLLGVAGRFTPWKGQDFLVRIAEAWVKRSRPGHFVLIGHSFNEDQPFERHLRDEVRRRGLEERVHFIPFQSDMAAALSDLDVFVHTSLKPEPFGRVLIEAMAVEVPVIGANHGGVPEIITHGVNGLLAAPGNLSAYLAAIEMLIGDEAVRRRLAAAGRAQVVDQFPIWRVRAGFDQLFGTVGAGWSSEES